jgi:hypothetical protein
LHPAAVITQNVGLSLWPVSEYERPTVPFVPQLGEVVSPAAQEARSLQRGIERSAAMATDAHDADIVPGSNDVMSRSISAIRI